MVGTSDPVAFECSCKAPEIGGAILLFYRYFAAPPELPDLQDIDVQELYAFHSSVCERLSLRGKIRVASEGFNVTVGGTNDELEAYKQECIQHWSFAGLNLDTPAKRDKFFKPSANGCACAFERLNVRITSEITPFGITNYTPKDWGIVQTLTPAEFHEKCWADSDNVLIDIRNHYESRIGHFINPKSGDKAIMPEVRRFSQFPLYVKTHLEDLQSLNRPTAILTYCTGGIRCEKSVRWMAERMQPKSKRTFYTLEGGIAAYLTWMDAEIQTGRKLPDDSLFRGRNYVFDGRGSVGLAGGGAVPVSECHMCHRPSDRLSKCRSPGCHLVLVVCEDCEDCRDPRCCTSCSEKNSSQSPQTRRLLCSCEREREERLRS